MLWSFVDKTPFGQMCWSSPVCFNLSLISDQRAHVVQANDDRQRLKVRDGVLLLELLAMYAEDCLVLLRHPHGDPVAAIPYANRRVPRLRSIPKAIRVNAFNPYSVLYFGSV